MTVRRRKVWRGSKYKAWRERYHLKPIISVLFYLIIPLVSIYLIMLQYPHLGKTRFINMVYWIVPFGLALLAVTLVQEKHAKGTRTRLGLDAIFVALAMGWLFGFLGGRTVVENHYDDWYFAVDVGPVVAIALIGTGMNFIHDILEYLANSETPAILHLPQKSRAGAILKKLTKGSNRDKGKVTLRFE